MKRSRILIVDDQELIRRFCRRALEPEFDVATAEGVHEALRSIGAGGADMVLTDVAMSEADDGWRLLKVIRNVCPACPVVLMTGSPFGSFAERAEAAGAAGSLVKPFSAEALRRLVRERLAPGARRP